MVSLGGQRCPRPAGFPAGRLPVGVVGHRQAVTSQYDPKGRGEGRRCRTGGFRMDGWSGWGGESLPGKGARGPSPADLSLLPPCRPQGRSPTSAPCAGDPSRCATTCSSTWSRTRACAPSSAPSAPSASRRRARSTCTCAPTGRSARRAPPAARSSRTARCWSATWPRTLRPDPGMGPGHAHRGIGQAPPAVTPAAAT